MATSNQEVIDETLASTEDYKMRVRDTTFNCDKLSWEICLKIDSLEQQIKGDKRFLEEQATEREGEREEFNRRIEHLEEVIKRKEKEEDKENSLLMASNKVKYYDKILWLKTNIVVDHLKRNDLRQSLRLSLTLERKDCTAPKELLHPMS